MAFQIRNLLSNFKMETIAIEAKDNWGSTGSSVVGAAACKR